MNIRLRFANYFFSVLGISLLLVFSVASFGWTLSAESPNPSSFPTVEDSVITYNGPETWTYDDGDVRYYEQKFGVDCSTGKCLLFIDLNENVPANTEIFDGRASFEIVASGTPCSDGYEYPGTVSAVFDGGTATLTQVKGLLHC